jgi:hypothetical protein
VIEQQSDRSQMLSDRRHLVVPLQLVHVAVDGERREVDKLKIPVFAPICESYQRLDVGIARVAVADARQKVKRTRLSLRPRPPDDPRQAACQIA